MDSHAWIQHAAQHGHELRISASDNGVVIDADDTAALRWARRSRRLMADEWNARVVSKDEYAQEAA